VIDCIIASYETDAVAVRTAELADVVDARVILQATSTFNGREPVDVLYESTWDGVTVVLADLPDGLDPKQSEHWLRDQSLIQARAMYGDDHLFLVADGDEIPHPDAIRWARAARVPAVLNTDYREWWMDWRAPDTWQLVHQPVIGSAADYDRAGGAQAARTSRLGGATVAPGRGWHLSTLGDAALAARKLSTFSHDEFSGPEHNDLGKLAIYRDRGRDLLDRFDLIPTADLPACAPAFPELLSPAFREELD